MFRVKWVARGSKETSLEVERYRISNPDVIVLGCRLRLKDVRTANPGVSVDGFIVLDDGAKIVREWFPE
jgi:hypothetical protein